MITTTGNICLTKYAIGEAREQYKQAVKLQPDFDEAQYNLGMTYLSVGEWKEAAELFKRIAIQERPNNTVSVMRRSPTGASLRICTNA